MRSKTRTISTPDGSRVKRSFADDDRAIEGLPIRLVIALIVGVASLGIMMQMLGSVGPLEDKTEVKVEFEDATVDVNNPNSFTVSVIDEDGNEVTDATIIAEAGSARMDNAIGEETGANSNEADFDFGIDGGLELPPDQSTGTIEFTVQPPPDSNWEDSQPNNELIVID